MMSEGGATAARAEQTGQVIGAAVVVTEREGVVAVVVAVVAQGCPEAMLEVGWVATARAVVVKVGASWEQETAAVAISGAVEGAMAGEAMVEERMVVCAAEAVRAEVARAAAAAVGARALVAEAMAVVVGWALGRVEA